MQENVELCLELQMDDYVKDILASPEKCRSTLLDVTVIKPVELEAFGTQRVNVLKADQVRKLIASMEKQRREKQRLINNLRCDDTIIKVQKHDGGGRGTWRKGGKRVQIRNETKKPASDYEETDQSGFCKIRKSLRNVKTKIADLRDRSVVISQTTTDETTSDELRYYGKNSFNCGDHLKNTYIYRAARSIQDLKSILVCKNRNRLGGSEKFDGKCLCENCGIVGHLLECQKHPYYAALSESPAGTPKDKKKVKEKKEVEQDINVEALTKRIRTLEERLAVQEERAIPRDYFKKIIGKLVANFSPRSELSSPRSKTKIEKNPQLVDAKQRMKNVARVNQSDIPPELVSCFHVTHQQQQSHQREDFRLPKFKTTKEGFSNVPSDKATFTDNEPYYPGTFWRWGGEMLKPGIDLKKKIVTLLHDILSKFNLADKTFDPRERVDPSRLRGAEATYNEMFKKFVDHMNTKVFTAQMQEGYNCFPSARNASRGYHRNSENSGESQGYGARFRDNQERREGFSENTGTKKVDVAYVNPKLSVWDEESTTKCENVNYSGGGCNKMGKDEFLRIIMKAKRSQKELLWRNIWNQAKANGQTKHDKINIKVPMLRKDGRASDQIYEIELPIGEVEKLLRCHRLSFR